MSTDKVIRVATPSELDQVLDESSGELVVIHFSATWCGSCKVIAPTFQEYSSTYDAVFIYVDVDKLAKHPLTKTVNGVPTFRLLRNRDLLEEFSGSNAATLKDNIETQLKATIFPRFPRVKRYSSV
eukprot:Phypoly_transcript_22687.p1 GENE.Phypoly_transcript_22687~~Phypoly_transcript_22687.p1  ORF type:complete len:126 (+),score=11.72 Phypoly_transcript_22687:73-450(+)